MSRDYPASENIHPYEKEERVCVLNTENRIIQEEGGAGAESKMRVS